jgi:hypothetical protein
LEGKERRAATGGEEEGEEKEAQLRWPVPGLGTGEEVRERRRTGSVWLREEDELV